MRRFEGSELLIATHNRGKLDEFQALLGPLGITCRSNEDFGLPEPEETEESFVGNARIKARAAVGATGLPALADDSGIEIDGLDGAPGVHTADWAETPQGRDFTVAMTRAWSELEARDAPEPRTARFRATLLLMWPDGHEEVFEGAVAGRVVWPMRGTLGHGYDPIFLPDGHDRTFGEMSAEEKNRLSHRAVALRKMAACFGRP
ncbi:RdgB/HAM1 family non-canonical purine NTP pyrophosphatase [Jannaschia rubra]|uniref:dITP/XTP pyrophosphatase n=1 Tax=Jannaschia rubra TaxID=282197 RepID=A0A0M6XQ25_9RHOB|nr:RdgB/HAM1 family non-canonical purine NTP pyrophosphatase [Jannaschia rubra]CTQ32772.1 Non-canonical purine NTP pyrophosphatase [Jannaschia rubra]SFF89225.1 dITPase [Jannaschia rubra]